MPDYFTLLRDRVTLKCRSIDRIFLQQAYVPKLQSVGQVFIFLRWRRKFKVPSSAAFGKIGEAYVQAIHEFAKAHGIPVVRFEKGQNKEKVARPFLEAVGSGRQGSSRVDWHRSREGLGLALLAQGSGEGRSSTQGVGSANGLRQPFLLLPLGLGLGWRFLEDQRLCPYPIWLWLNGHEWAKRQLVRAHLGYEALDNGFRSCKDPLVLQKICDRLGPGAVKNFFWRWLHRLPSPFTSADWKAGYGYDLAFRQFEISETCVFDRPQAGRMWFEGVIRDHRDVGRPDQVMLIFDRQLRRCTPGPFRTRVLTEGVDPTLTCYYKSSRLKQYFKEGRALRTETVICDTRDFGIGRQVCAKNW